MECPFVKLATEAFLVFDATNNESVDVREVGTIIRSLGEYGFLCYICTTPELSRPSNERHLMKTTILEGCCPSESELQHLVTAMEGDGTTQFIPLQKFAPTVSGILQQKR